MLASGVFINCTGLFTTESITSSKPHEYFPLSFFTTFSTLISDTGLMNIVCGHVFIFKLAIFKVACVPLFWSANFSAGSTKYELNNSVISLGFDV
jgi:hypothetical protein